MAERWHKGSRFWRIALLVVLLQYSLCWAAIFFAEEQVGIAFAAFGTLALAIIGGGTVQNVQERKQQGAGG